MDEPTPAQSGRAKEPGRAKGNVARLSRHLGSALVRDGYKEIMTYLPDTKLMKFTEHERNGKKSVQFELGKSLGVIFAYPDDEVVRYSYDTETSTPVTEEHAKWNYVGVFQPPPPFNWNDDILRGLRTPMSPRTLALVQFYCLLACRDEKWFHITLPEPDYGSLCQALDTLKADWQFLELVRTGQVHETPDFGVSSQDSTSSSDAESHRSASFDPIEGISQDDLFNDIGSFAPEQAQKISSSSSTSVVNSKSHDTETGRDIIPQSYVSHALRSNRFVEQGQRGSASPIPDHEISEDSQSVIEQIVSSRRERFRTAHPHHAGNSVLSAMAPASGVELESLPPWLERAGRVHINSTSRAKDEEETRLTSVICGPDARALDLVREHVSGDELAAIWTLDKNDFSVHQDTSFAMLRLYIPGRQGSSARSDSKVFAYISPGWNDYMNPNLTLRLETQKTRSGEVAIRTILSRGEEARNNAYGIENVLIASKAINKRELIAMIMYAFLLVREIELHGWKDNIVPIYPGFLLDLHRLGSRLLDQSDTTSSSESPMPANPSSPLFEPERSTSDTSSSVSSMSESPGSSLFEPTQSKSVSSFRPSDSESSFQTSSTSSRTKSSSSPSCKTKVTRRGTGKVEKPRKPNFKLPATPPSFSVARRAVGKQRKTEISSSSGYTPAHDTPSKKSKTRNMFAERRGAPRPPLTIQEIEWKRKNEIQNRENFLKKAVKYTGKVTESNTKISKYDDEITKWRNENGG